MTFQLLYFISGLDHGTVMEMDKEEFDWWHHELAEQKKREKPKGKGAAE